MIEVRETWYCMAPGAQLTVRCVGVVTAYEIRQFAAKRLGVDPSAVAARLLTADAPLPEPVVDLQWAGDDYAHGGSKGGRRMQVRDAGQDAWSDA